MFCVGIPCSLYELSEERSKEYPNLRKDRDSVSKFNLDYRISARLKVELKIRLCTLFDKTKFFKESIKEGMRKLDVSLKHIGIGCDLRLLKDVFSLAIEDKLDSESAAYVLEYFLTVYDMAFNLIYSYAR